MDGNTSFFKKCKSLSHYSSVKIYGVYSKKVYFSLTTAHQFSGYLLRDCSYQFLMGSSSDILNIYWYKGIYLLKKNPKL